MKKFDFHTAKDYLNYMYSDMQGWIAKSTNLKYYSEHFYHASTIMDQRSIDNQKSVYISMNTFFKKNRQVVSLKRLNACYVDLDCYKLGISKETVLYMLDQFYFGKKLPIPTFVIDSGRGLYLIWKLQNEDRNALPRWQKVQEHFIHICKQFGADSACSDAARIFRIPFSINERNGEKVKILRFHDYAYTLYEIIKEYDIPYAPYNKKKRKYVTDKMRRFALHIAKEKKLNLPDFENYHETFDYIKKNYIKKQYIVHSDVTQENWKVSLWTKKLLISRCNDLERLFALRKGENCKREIALFLYRLWQILITEDYEKALQKTLEFNQKLDCPFDNQYVIIRSRSAEKILKKGRLYKYSNKRIIQDLEITDQEKKYLSVLTDTDKNRKRKKKERNRKNYVERLANKGDLEKKEKMGLRREALVSMQKKGFSVKDICQKLNISKATYYRDMAIIDRTKTDKAGRSIPSSISKKKIREIVKKKMQAVCDTKKDKQTKKNLNQIVRKGVSFFQPIYYKCTPLGVLRAPICHSFVFNTS